VRHDADDGALVVLGVLGGLAVAVVLPPLAAGAVLRGGRPASAPGAVGRLWARGSTSGWPGRPPLLLMIGLTTFFTFLVVTVAVIVGTWLWRGGGAAHGLATRSDVLRSLSTAAVRRSSRVTRPSLQGRAPTGELGVPLGRHGRSKVALWAPWSDCHGLIAPTQTGKTLRVLVHQVLSAPGFTIVTSTKPDLLRLTAAQRAALGHPIWVLDTNSDAHPWPAVRWSPVAGCRDLGVAERRADALIHASPGRSGSPTDAFFTAQARQVLTALLCAAAHHDAGIDCVLQWLADPSDREPITLLHRAGLPIHARQLVAVQTMVPETRDGTLATIANALNCLTRPDILAAATPNADDAFDVDLAIRSQSTVYVIGAATAVGTTAPLVTAFVEELLDRARVAGGGGRLDPPALAVLDEVANIAPLPHLPETISDSAGRGVVISYALQSLGQARARWGPDRAAVLIDNSTSLLILGGGKNKADLAALASLGGVFEARRESYGRGDRHHQRTTSLQRQPVLDPADVRRLGPGRGLLIYRDLPPVLTVHRGLWETRRG
jgi:type IV secretory pathway TraG/TraD family ATPase VirD4